jgi:undecaprenyl phosphate N,N'-diacetylbacillosamine 1-phosphate transferase
MYRYIKRFIDLFGSFFGLLLLSPIFLIVLIILLFANSGKPFFFQSRPGKNENIFNIIKFKTMNDKKDKNGDFLPYEKRVTKIGLFLRKSSLDEIPQLLNVLIGQMSLIGPRPLLIKYLPLYNKTQQRRHDVKPGVTGWAQVNGRNAISWDEKFEFDIWYTQNVSLKLDFKILLLTIKKVIYSEEVNSGENINMEPFVGSKVKK